MGGGVSDVDYFPRWEGHKRIRHPHRHIETHRTSVVGDNQNRELIISGSAEHTRQGAVRTQRQLGRQIRMAKNAQNVQLRAAENRHRRYPPATAAARTKMWTDPARFPSDDILPVVCISQPLWRR